MGLAQEQTTLCCNYGPFNPIIPSQSLVHLITQLNAEGYNVFHTFERRALRWLLGSWAREGSAFCTVSDCSLLSLKVFNILHICIHRYIDNIHTFESWIIYLSLLGGCSTAAHRKRPGFVGSCQPSAVRLECLTGLLLGMFTTHPRLLQMLIAHRFKWFGVTLRMLGSTSAKDSKKDLMQLHAGWKNNHCHAMMLLVSNREGDKEF